jgi:hypothetical protein
MLDEYDLAKLSSSTAPTLLDACHLIEIREAPGKGLGIFAREKISRGTRIIAESPLLKATTVSSHGVNVQAAFNNLPLPKQRAYLDLHGHASETLKKDNDWKSLPDLNRRVLAIYAANHWGRDVFGLRLDSTIPASRIFTMHTIRPSRWRHFTAYRKSKQARSSPFPTFLALVCGTSDKRS